MILYSQYYSQHCCWKVKSLSPHSIGKNPTNYSPTKTNAKNSVVLFFGAQKDRNHWMEKKNVFFFSPNFFHIFTYFIFFLYLLCDLFFPSMPNNRFGCKISIAGCLRSWCWNGEWSYFRHVKQYQAFGRGLPIGMALWNSPFWDFKCM